MPDQQAQQPNQPDPQTLSYEQAVAQLERIIDQIERGQIGLEDCLAQYECGIGLIKRCQSILQRAQQRVAELTTDAQGQLQVQPDQSESSPDTPGQ